MVRPHRPRLLKISVANSFYSPNKIVMPTPKNRIAVLQPLAKWEKPADFLGIIFNWDTLWTENEYSNENKDAIIALLQKIQQAGFLILAMSSQSSQNIQKTIYNQSNFPLQALLAENGALAWVKTKNNIFEKHYFFKNPDAHAIIQDRLLRMTRHLEASVVGLRRTRDWRGRECSLSMDHGEMCNASRARILQSLTILKVAGFQSIVTEKHLHAWYGRHTPLKSIAWVLDDFFQCNLENTAPRWLYVSGAAHDAKLFEYFPNSVGLAQIFPHLAYMPNKPTFLAPSNHITGLISVMEKLFKNANNSPIT